MPIATEVGYCVYTFSADRTGGGAVNLLHVDKVGPCLCWKKSLRGRDHGLTCERAGAAGGSSAPPLSLDHASSLPSPP